MLPATSTSNGPIGPMKTGPMKTGIPNRIGLCLEPHVLLSAQDLMALRQKAATDSNGKNLLIREAQRLLDAQVQPRLSGPRDRYFVFDEAEGKGYACFPGGYDAPPGAWAGANHLEIDGYNAVTLALAYQTLTDDQMSAEDRARAAQLAGAIIDRWTSSVSGLAALNEVSSAGLYCDEFMAAYAFGIYGVQLVYAADLLGSARAENGNPVFDRAALIHYLNVSLMTKHGSPEPFDWDGWISYYSNISELAQLYKTTKAAYECDEAGLAAARDAFLVHLTLAVGHGDDYAYDGTCAERFGSSYGYRNDAARSDGGESDQTCNATSGLGYQEWAFQADIVNAEILRKNAAHAADIFLVGPDGTTTSHPSMLDIYHSLADWENFILPDVVGDANAKPYQFNRAGRPDPLPMASPYYGVDADYSMPLKSIGAPIPFGTLSMSADVGIDNGVTSYANHFAMMHYMWELAAARMGPYPNADVMLGYAGSRRDLPRRPFNTLNSAIFSTYGADLVDVLDSMATPASTHATFLWGP